MGTTRPQLYENAKEMVARQKYAEAIPVLTEAIQHDPNLFDAYFDRATAYRRTGQYMEALADYSRLISVAPSRVDALYGRGLVQIRLENYKDAIADFSKVVAQTPEDVGAFINRGNAYRKLSAFVEATNDYLAALRIDPQDLDALLALAETYALCQSWSDAIRVYDSVVRIDRLRQESWFGRGLAHAKTKEFPAAVQDFSKVIELAPAHQAAYYERANAYKQTGEPLKAAVDYGKVTELGTFDAFSDANLSSFANFNKRYHQFEAALLLAPKRFYDSKAPSVGVSDHIDTGVSFYVRDPKFGIVELAIWKRTERSGIVLSTASDVSRTNFQIEHWDTLASALRRLPVLLAGREIFLETLFVFGIPCDVETYRLVRQLLWLTGNIAGDESDEIATDAAQIWNIRSQIGRHTLVSALKGGASGIALWNEFSARNFFGELPKIDLESAQLAGVSFLKLHMCSCNFTRAKMPSACCVEADLSNSIFVGAELDGTDLSRAKAKEADFSEASMKKIVSEQACFHNAKFRNSDLSGAVFKTTDLRGADFSGAKLSKARLSRCVIDDTTKFPPGFTVPEDSVWNIDPTSKYVYDCSNMQTLLYYLDTTFKDSRLDSALKMLRSDRFQLFSKLSNEDLAGIVKSQRDPNLVYACSLQSDGTYACCTQNLNACGGLRSALCKHLLVLIIGLIRTDQLSPNRAALWCRSTWYKSPEFDKDMLADLFLQYKAAEAGEIDWRPTETIPEDYYSY